MPCVVKLANNYDGVSTAPLLESCTSFTTCIVYSSETVAAAQQTSCRWVSTNRLCEKNLLKKAGKRSLQRFRPF
jgi:hypothetical protein